MKKIITISLALLMVACKKETNTPPASTSDTHSLTLNSGGSNTFKLYINNVIQPFGVTSFTVKKGDVVYAVDKGVDTTTLNPDGTIKSHNEGSVYVLIYIDNVQKYNQQCACDANFNYTI